MTPEQLKLSILRYFLSKPEGSLSLSLWKTYKLKDIAKLINGRAYKKDELLTDPSMTPVLRVGNLFTSKEWYYSDLSLPKEKYVSEGDLIYCWSASFGPSIWTGPKAIFHYHIWKLILSDKIDKKYLFYFLSDKNNIFGETEIHGSTMHHLTKRGMENINILVPPLKEQKLIITKIEQLMPLVDQYALAYNRLKEIDNSFNDKMKQSILQYAMEGKLVEQDPTDVPASELLKTISAEKAQLIKEKKIKRSKKLPEITQEEKPFKIPTSWEWVRLGNLVDILSGRDLPKANHLSSQIPKSIPYITGASNISDNQLQITTWTSDPITIAKRGDILLTVKGTIGKIAILDMSQAHIARQLMALTILSNNISKEYLIIFLNWYVFSLKEKARSIIPGVSRQDVEKGLVPFPPLDEQKRIVAKISSLFQKL
ncbi:restriction endonuclease subunit S [Levilactobacillus brevis]|uniref:restriction endonuclease subunit S n=1 Tax=Levilactobacillus brevis TaxID=1580 RepID=UPI00111BB78C|nr:restriction endonuclease subunit S [Levilactobacillus brevis]QCZ47120.1 hypothetical protein UCCLB556_pA0011 [Levilactobacillus brevis]